MSIIKNLQDYFISKFHESGESILPFLCESKVSVLTFMAAYKKLPPIEDLDPEEKTKMKKYVHTMFPGKSVDFKLQAAKIIYTVGTLS